MAKLTKAQRRIRKERHRIAVDGITVNESPSNVDSKLFGFLDGMRHAEKLAAK